MARPEGRRPSGGLCSLFSFFPASPVSITTEAHGHYKVTPAEVRESGAASITMKAHAGLTGDMATTKSHLPKLGSQVQLPDHSLVIF